MTQPVPAEYRDVADAPSSASKLESIEGMRGLLALLVCCGHLGLNTAAAHFGIEVNFGVAVDVFFILSGFVLTKSYYFGKRSFGRSVKARIARLYPLHALTLLLTLSLFLASAKPVDWTVVFQHAALIHNIGLPPNHFDLNYPSWSISVEMALSLLFWFVIRKNSDILYPALIVTGMCFSYIAFDGSFEAYHNKWHAFNIGILRGIAGFCLGSAAYMVTERFGRELRMCRFLSIPLFITILILLMIKKWYAETAVLFEIMTFLFLIVSTANDEVSILSLPIFVFLGTISYSVYLLHMPLSFAMEFLLPEEATKGIGKLMQLIVIIAAATLSYRYFEVPMQRLIMRIPLGARDHAKRNASRWCFSGAAAFVRSCAKIWLKGIF